MWDRTISIEGSHFQVSNKACRVYDERKFVSVSGIVSSHIIRQIIIYLCPTWKWSPMEKNILLLNYAVKCKINTIFEIIVYVLGLCHRYKTVNEQYESILVLDSVKIDRTILKGLIAFFYLEFFIKEKLGRGRHLFTVKKKITIYIELVFSNRVRLMWFSTFNNISVLSWRSVLLVEETEENHRPAASHWQTLSHDVVSSTPLHERDSNSQLLWW